MSKLIAISVDVTKLDKSKFITGKKGTYVNLTVSVNDSADQFGNDSSVWQSQSEEERKAKADRAFCGNGKVVYDSESKGTTTASKKQDVVEDLPF